MKHNRYISVIKDGKIVVQDGLIQQKGLAYTCLYRREGDDVVGHLFEIGVTKEVKDEATKTTSMVVERHKDLSLPGPKHGFYENPDHVPAAEPEPEKKRAAK